MPRNPKPKTRYPSPRRSRQSGFTLIEAALTTVIVGTGVLAIVGAQQAYHQKNGWAQRTGTAMLLANEVRELTLPLPLFDPINGLAAPAGPDAGEASVVDYDDLDDFAGVSSDGGTTFPGSTFSPPIDALRRPIQGMDQWTQVVTVESVLEGDIASTITPDLGTTSLMRVRVDVQYQGPTDPNPRTVTQLTWLVSR
jgi:hypothetical protein